MDPVEREDNQILIREILALMSETYRARLMNWENVAAASANADTAARAFLDGDFKEAKAVYELARSQFDVVIHRRRAEFNILYEALIEPRKRAGREKNSEASLFFQELLDAHSFEL